MCDDHQNPQAIDISQFTKLIEKVAKDLHDGKIKPEDLNAGLVKEIYSELSTGMASGFGKGFFKYTDDNAKRILDLKQNLYKFSGAKTYQQMAKLNFLLQGDDGNPRSWQEFKEQALKINNEYNLNYLRTEYNTALRSGAMAAKWAKYESQARLYPNLKYKTAKDDRVRDDHKQMEDIIKPVNDPFWDKWYPPNGHNCRCYVEQTSQAATKGTPEGNPQMGFHNNVAKSGKAFNEDHPYFLIPREEAKKVREGFEQMKVAEPAYEVLHEGKKGNLEGSIWADNKDFMSNLKAGKIIVDNLKHDVKIRPHVKTQGVKNPELLIDDELADLKEINGYRGVLGGLDSAKKQGATNVVFNLDGIKDLEIQDLYRRIKGDITEDRRKTIKNLIFIYKNKAVSISREDILKDDFRQTLEKLKATS
jgi:SPP1 gp7 family putative phage head morphogenesis protein